MSETPKRRKAVPTDIAPNIVPQVLLEDVLDAVPQQVAVLDEKGAITYTNGAWERFAKDGPPLYARRGANYLNVCKEAQKAGEDAEAYSQQIYRGLHNVLEGASEYFTLEYACPTHSGEKWFVMHIKPLAAGGALVSHLDVTSRRHFEREMERVAYTDALTGLPNRRAFFERAAQTIASAKRHARELQLLYIDLDGFKSVNDTLGHDAGDQLLVAVAERFKRQMRASDLLARLGGDEFACLLEVQPQGYYERGGYGGYGDAAKQVAERYAACLEAPFRLGREEIYLSASVGVAQFPQAGSTLRTLLKRADGKMYEDKRYKVSAAGGAKAMTQRVSLEELRPG